MKRAVGFKPEFVGPMNAMPPNIQNPLGSLPDMAGKLRAMAEAMPSDDFHWGMQFWMKNAAHDIDQALAETTDAARLYREGLAGEEVPNQKQKDARADSNFVDEEYS